LISVVKMSTQDSGNSQQAFPALCKNGCGFFGGIENQGYCSVCFKKEQLKKEAAEKSETKVDVETNKTSDSLSKLTLEEEESPQESEAIKDVVAIKEEISTSSTDGATAVVEAVTEAKDEEPKVDTKKKKNRCLVCKKKVGLTGFNCRCGGLFCSIHRYSDKHECNFDFKAMGKKEISEANPVIVAQKINKI